MVKNPPANAGDIRDSGYVSSLGWEDRLEKGMTNTPVFLPGESHGQRTLAGYLVKMDRVSTAKDRVESSAWQSSQMDEAA